MRFALLFFLLRGVAGSPPSFYDAYDARCHSFVAEDQGTCNACAAAAVASSLGLRACLHGGRNVRFVSQQLWDCFPGDCNGVDMDEFMFSVIHGMRSKFMLLISDSPARPKRIVPSNYTSCALGNSSERIVSVSQHKESWLANRINASVKLMQDEIMMHGPIVAVLSLTPSELAGFSQWRGEAILTMAPSPRGELRTRKHAVTVYGWGIEGSTGRFYWRILNSFGSQWGKNGTANIPGDFALIGNEWYSVSSFLAVPAKGAKEEEDVMIADVHLPIVKVKYKERSGIKDASVLSIVVVCMVIVSLVICTFDKKMSLFSPCPAPKMHSRQISFC